MSASGAFQGLEPGGPRVTDKPSTLLDRRAMLLGTTVAAVTAAAAQSTSIAQAQPAPSGRKPNIVVIMGDDIGMWNIGAYHRGMMGGRTPKPHKPAPASLLFPHHFPQA